MQTNHCPFGSRLNVAPFVTPSSGRWTTARIADLRHRHRLGVRHHPLWDTKARRVRLTRLTFREPLPLRALPHPPKEVLVGASEIPRRLLQQLRIHLTQPGRFWSLFHLGKFTREIVIRKRLARLLIVVDRAVQGPIPDKPTRPSKLIEHGFLRNRWIEAVAVGCLDGSRHGASIPDYLFYYKWFGALGRCME